MFKLFSHGEMQIALPEGYRDVSRIMFRRNDDGANFQVTRYPDVGTDFSAFHAAYSERIMAELAPFHPAVVRSDVLAADPLSGWITVVSLELSGKGLTQLQAHISTIQNSDVVVIVWTGDAQQYRIHENELLRAAAELKVVGSA